jgi:hypothetical protein
MRTTHSILAVMAVAGMAGCNSLLGIDEILLVDGGDVDAAFDAPDGTPPEAPRNIAFVTSTTMTGNFGGRDAADALCNTLAHDAGHEGNFRAYLSTTSEHALARIASARGWVRTDGQPFADTPQLLANKGPFTAIRLDERGQPVPEPAGIWTATRRGYYNSGSSGNCSNWSRETSATEPEVTLTATSGAATMGGAGFQFVVSSMCNTRARLLCMQIDHTTPVAPPPVPNHKLAFVTTTSWLPDGGLTGADAFCNEEATDHNRTGRFRAAVAAGGSSAASRFLATYGPG